MRLSARLDSLDTDWQQVQWKSWLFIVHKPLVFSKKVDSFKDQGMSRHVSEQLILLIFEVLQFIHNKLGIDPVVPRLSLASFARILLPSDHPTVSGLLIWHWTEEAKHNTWTFGQHRWWVLYGAKVGISGDVLLIFALWLSMNRCPTKVCGWSWLPCLGTQRECHWRPFG